MKSIDTNHAKRRTEILLWTLALGAVTALPPPARAALHPVAVVAEVNVSIEVAPPPPRREVFVEHDRPSRDHVWVPGYWAWRHEHHEWVAGRWERPPHGMHTWVEPRWEHRGHSYVFIDGTWR